VFVAELSGDIEVDVVEVGGLVDPVGHFSIW